MPPDHQHLSIDSDYSQKVNQNDFETSSIISGVHRLTNSTKEPAKQVENQCQELEVQNSDISEEARRAWEVGKKLGLLSKVPDEIMIDHMERLESEDRAKMKRKQRANKQGGRKSS
ncbi:hypothetical protein ACS0TY_003486 [Phlomoides rotata]